MSAIKYILLCSIFFYSQLVSQTTQIYFNNFNDGLDPSWSFTSSSGDITLQNEELKFTSTSDEFVFMFPTIGATKDDFSFRIKSGSVNTGIEGGGIARLGFKSGIVLEMSDNLYGDSIVVGYLENVSSFDDGRLRTLISYPMPEIINSLQLDATKSGNNINIKAYVNDGIFYDGIIENPDSGLFTGNMIIMIDPEDETSLVEWSLDEIEINYTPALNTPGNFIDNFDDPNSPWFIFGDYDNMYQSINISNGVLNFNYSGDDETALYVVPPIGTVKDFALEFEATAQELHNAPLGISRFYNYKNYTTMFFEDDSVYIGYAQDSWDLTIIGVAPVNYTENGMKVKFSIEGEAPNLTFKVWLNDLLAVSGDVVDAAEKLGYGTIMLGYYGGNYIGATIDNVIINYSEFVTSIEGIETTLPSTFVIKQNYPNPFNPSTVINFTLPEMTIINITVYNSIGEKVTELVNQEMPAGYHSVNFNATNLSSGIYFYRISAGNFTQTNKMMLVR